jgi:hypothetical protein
MVFKKERITGTYSNYDDVLVGNYFGISGFWHIDVSREERI